VRALEPRPLTVAGSARPAGRFSRKSPYRPKALPRAGLGHTCGDFSRRSLYYRYWWSIPPRADARE
jgi:hypothetical protein